MSIFLKTEKIINEWTDYNGHMNMAFYIHIFDNAAEVMLNKFNIGEDSAKKDKKSTFVVETHTTYHQEVKVNEEIEVNLIYLDYDKKRIQYKLSMIHKLRKYLAATTEVLSLYIDLNKRRVSEFEIEKIKIIDDFIQVHNSRFNDENLIFTSRLKK